MAASLPWITGTEFRLGLLRSGSDMRTDSTHVLASIRRMNRSELVGETFRAALNLLMRRMNATVSLLKALGGSWQPGMLPAPSQMGPSSAPTQDRSQARARS